VFNKKLNKENGSTIDKKKPSHLPEIEEKNTEIEAIYYVYI